MKKVGGLGSAISGLTGLSAMGIGGAAFTGFLDSISNVEHVYLLFRGLSSYTGNLVRLRRSSDDAEADFTYVSDSDESLDVAAITAWLAGATPYVVTLYDQAADDITQGTAANQPELVESDATVNNRPSMNFDGTDYLQGAFTIGGSISQPNTFYTVVELDNYASGSAEYFYDGDDSTNRNVLFKQGTGQDDWNIFAGTILDGGVADNNWHIWTALFNGNSSEFWDSGISEASGVAGANSMDGLTLGAAYNATSPLDGSHLGLIIVDGNSSNADKNIIGQKFDSYYGISYTDI